MTKSKNPLNKKAKELEEKSHTFVRRRDSKDKDFIGGYCFDCGNWSEGRFFQAGHWEPSGSCGALLRFHPHNIHGQSAGCNCKYQQEKVKINYTLKMIDKYGREYVDHLKSFKYKSIKADIIFYDTMIALYDKGIEQDIVDYLESLV